MVTRRPCRRARKQAFFSVPESQQVGVSSPGPFVPKVADIYSTL